METIGLQRFDSPGYGRLRLNTSLPIRKGSFSILKSMFLTVTCRNLVSIIWKEIFL